MKKLLWILLLALSFTIKINAQPPYEDLSIKELMTAIKNDIPMDAQIYYNALTDNEKTHYDGILQSYLAGNLEADYTFEKPEGSALTLEQSREDIKNAYNAFLYEHKEFFFIGTYSLTSTKSYPPPTDSFEITLHILLAEDYYSTFDSADFSTRVIDETKIKAHFVEILLKRDVITNHVQTLDNDYLKIKYIHDYLILNNEYEKTNSLSHTPAGALVAGETPVCEAYSEAFQMLAHHNNIIVSYASGLANNGHTEELHAWNHVKLGTHWYLIDVTWDDPLGMDVNYIGNDYFLIPKQAPHLRNYDEHSIVPSPFTSLKYGDKPTYNVTITVDGETHHQAVLEGDDVDLSAFEKPGYQMVVTGDYQNINEEKSITITYTHRTYTIRFLNGFTVIDTQTLNYGDVPTIPEDPTKENYTFKGWSPEVKNVDSDQDYHAVYEPIEDNPMMMILLLSGVGLVGVIALTVLFRLLFKKK